MMTKGQQVRIKQPGRTRGKVGTVCSIYPGRKGQSRFDLCYVLLDDSTAVIPVEAEDLEMVK